MDIPQQNTGVVLGVRETDWIAGTIPYEIRVPSGDWRPFLPFEEKQYSDNTDTMGCVSFSDNNSMEMQYKQQTGKDINFSDRWLAKMSDTQTFGNWQYKVADAIRIHGLVLEYEYPAPPDYTWNSYYAAIPGSVMEKAKKYDTRYEWVGISKSDLEYHLKHAPLQIVITKQNPNHAVALVAIEGDTGFYFDTYPPYLKTIKLDNIYNALKLVINFQPTMQLVNDNGTIYIVSGNKDKRKIGIADPETLGLFGDEPQVPMDTSSIPEFQTISKGFIINNK